MGSTACSLLLVLCYRVVRFGALCSAATVGFEIRMMMMMIMVMRWWWLALLLRVGCVVV